MGSLNQDLLIDSSEDDDFFNFLIASRDGAVDIMRDFLSRRAADVDNTDPVNFASATHFAAKGSNLLGLELLLSSGARLGNRNCHGSSEIHYAVINNNLEISSLLLDRKRELVDQVAGDGSGWNPLMLASFYGNCDMLNLLIRNGARINAQKTDGKSALIISINNEKFDAANLLLDQCTIDVSLATSSGNNALHFIADKNIADPMKKMVTLASKILEQDYTVLNALNNNGETALTVAIASGNISVTSLLLEQEGIIIDDKAREFLSTQDELFEPIRHKIAEIDLINSLQLTEDLRVSPGNSPEVISSASLAASQIIRANEEEGKDSATARTDLKEFYR